MYRATCLLLALSLILLTNGCGARGLRTEDNQGLRAESPPYPELQAALPALPSHPAEHQAANAGFITRAGVDTFAQSLNVSADPPALVLTPGAGEYSYAVYEFPLANSSWDRSISYDITIESESEDNGEDVWIGWSDYADGYWDFHKLIPGETGDQLPPGDWLSPLACFYFAVLAFDGSHARIAALSVPVVQYQWEIHVVETGTPSLAVSSSLAVVEDKPAVAYHTVFAVNYARATSATPASMSDWVKMAIDGSNAWEGGRVSLAEIAGKPMVAYDRLLAQVRFARALVVNPSFPLDWLALDLSPEDFSHLGQLTSVDGKPAVAWSYGLPVDLSPTPQLNYSYATAAEPGASDWVETEICTWSGAEYGLEPTPPGLAELSGDPIIAYYLRDTSSEYYEGDTEDLWFTRTLTAPPAGPADWHVTAIDTAGDVGRSAALAVVGGHPFLGYRDNTNGQLKAAVGAAPLNGPADFEFYTAAVDQGGGAQLPAVASVADRPAIAFWDEGQNALMLVWWQELYPAAAGDWPVFIVEEGLTSVAGISLAELGGMPVLTYFDLDASVLKFARLVDS